MEVLDKSEIIDSNNKTVFETSKTKSTESTKLPEEGFPMLQVNQTEAGDTTTSPKKRRGYLKVFFVQWAFLLATAIFAYFFVGELVQDMVNKELVISPESDFFSLWEKPPIEPIMKVYLFNITNLDEWVSGRAKKLRVEETGPYVYKETWTKTNVSFHKSNSTVSYRMQKKFQFIPERSDDENGQIIFPNIPLFSAGASMKGADAMTLMGFSAFMNNMMDDQSKQTFLKKSAKEVIWGYDDQLSNMAKFMLPPEEIGIPGKFGLLAGKNLTLGPWQTVNTGDKVLRQISQTVQYNGKTHFEAWGSEECNTIQGSDGSFFAPRTEANQIISIFVPDLCASIKLASDGQEVYFDSGQIKTFRFKPHSSTFNYDVKENKCYCTSNKKVTKPANDDDDDETSDWTDDWFEAEEDANGIETIQPTDPQESCPASGVLSLAPCKFGAPLYVSWPHFYLGDQSLLNGIDGLKKANEKEHGFYMDIQPTMGIGISASIRLQMNLKVESSPVLSGLPASLKESFLLPVMWFDDSIEVPPKDIMIMLRDALKSGPYLASKVLISFMVLLVLELVILVAYLVWRQKFEKQKNGDTTPWWRDLVDEFQCTNSK